MGQLTINRTFYDHDAFNNKNKNSNYFNKK